MTTAFLVGCGASGLRVARQLVDSPEIDRLIVTDRDPARHRLAAQLMGESVSEQPWPEPGSSAIDGWIGSIPDSVDVVIAAAPASTHAGLLDAAMAASIGFVSLTDDEEVVAELLARHTAARERGVRAVVGAGLAPGLVDVLAVHAARSLDAVDEVHIARYGVGGPACAEQHHRAGRGHLREWHDDSWVEHRSGSGRELVSFPEPIGPLDCYRISSSTGPLVHDALPDVHRITMRAAARRIDRFTAAIPMLRRPEPEGGWGAARVEVRGRRGSARELVVYGVVDRMVIVTGVVAAAAALAVVAGTVPAGVRGLGASVEPVPFLRELDHRGVRAATFLGTSVIPG